MSVVSILTDNFINEYEFPRLSGGRSERYVLALCGVIRALGHTPVVHQLSRSESFQTRTEQVDVFGHEYDPENIKAAFARMSAAARGPVIYAGLIGQILDYKRGSLGIAYDMHWARPGMPLEEKQQIAAHTQRALDELAQIVCANSHFLTYCQTTCAFNDPRQVVLIPNAVDTDYFASHHEKKPESAVSFIPNRVDKIRILYPCHVALEYGIIPMMLASDQLLGAFPEVEIEFAGDVDASSTVGRTFRYWHRTHPHADRIVYPHCNSEDTRGAYRRANIVALPALSAEGASSICLEAMSCGLPVVATHAGGLNDLIQNGLNGLLVPLGVEDLTAALVSLVEDQAERQRLGHYARQTAISRDISVWKSQWRKVLKPFLAHAALEDGVR